jgi:hypothetical protein
VHHRVDERLQLQHILSDVCWQHARRDQRKRLRLHASKCGALPGKSLFFLPDNRCPSYQAYKAFDNADVENLVWTARFTVGIYFVPCGLLTSKTDCLTHWCCGTRGIQSATGWFNHSVGDGCLVEPSSLVKGVDSFPTRRTPTLATWDAFRVLHKSQVITGRGHRCHCRAEKGYRSCREPGH